MRPPLPSLYLVMATTSSVSPWGDWRRGGRCSESGVPARRVPPRGTPRGQEGSGQGHGRPLLFVIRQCQPGRARHPASSVRKLGSPQGLQPPWASSGDSPLPPSCPAAGCVPLVGQFRTAGASPPCEVWGVPGGGNAPGGQGSGERWKLNLGFGQGDRLLELLPNVPETGPAGSRYAQFWGVSLSSAPDWKHWPRG